jgi:DNA-3-methyladenine glycosylase I
LTPTLESHAILAHLRLEGRHPVPGGEVKAPGAAKAPIRLFARTRRRQTDRHHRSGRRALEEAGVQAKSGRRCFGEGDPLFERYHDEEWGFPVLDERGLFERISLEAFQSGLSWRTILARRDAFRVAFTGFDPDALARYGDADVERLLADASIIRNRAKIEATLANARATVALRGAGVPLPELVRSHAHVARGRAPATWAEVPATTPDSTALARELKSGGFRFVGPTTVYALMQACGLVDDHLAGCPARPAVERARRAAGLI